MTNPNTTTVLNFLARQHFEGILAPGVFVELSPRAGEIAALVDKWTPEGVEDAARKVLGSRRRFWKARR